ncbi:hypothetical protein T03_15825, partial [Trichinella britovi]
LFCSIYNVACALYELRIAQWVVSVQWNYFYELEYLSQMIVRVSLNGLKRCTKICPEICVASLITAVRYNLMIIPHTSLVVRVAISAFGEYFCRVLCE